MRRNTQKDVVFAIKCCTNGGGDITTTNDGLWYEDGYLDFQTKMPEASPYEVSESPNRTLGKPQRGLETKKSSINIHLHASNTNARNKSWLLQKLNLNINNTVYGYML